MIALRGRCGRTLLGTGLFLAGCALPRPAPHPVAMVSLAPPEPPPHQATSLAVGGGAVFAADEVISVEADVPDVVRAYATADTLGLIGQKAGKTTLTLKLRAGDVFYFDVEVTTSPPTQHALVVGEAFVITYDGVKKYTLSGDGLSARKSDDDTQLIVTGNAPGAAFVALLMADGSIHHVELMFVGGQRLL